MIELAESLIETLDDLHSLALQRLDVVGVARKEYYVQALTEIAGVLFHALVEARDLHAQLELLPEEFTRPPAILDISPPDPAATATV